jgi:hypothetical protein
VDFGYFYLSFQGTARAASGDVVEIQGTGWVFDTDGDEPPEVEFPGFGGQTVASRFSRRSDAEVQAPGSWESSFGLRIH